MDVDSPLGINLTIILQGRQDKSDTVVQRHEEDIPLGFKRKSVLRMSVSGARLTDDVLRKKRLHSREIVSLIVQSLLELFGVVCINSSQTQTLIRTHTHLLSVNAHCCS